MKNGMDASLPEMTGSGGRGGPSRAYGIEVPKVEEWNLHRQTGGSEMKHSKTIVGVDTAKRVFQLHWVEMETGEMVSLQVKREKFLEHFANRAPCLIAMEISGFHQGQQAFPPA